MRNNHPLSPVADRIANASRGGAHLIVVAPPKSASTFFSNVLAECLGLKREVYWDKLSGPNDISIARAIELSDADYLIHCHSSASRKMLSLLSAIGARPVVLHRPIADSIVSMNEHRIRRGRALMDQALQGLELNDQLRLTAANWIDWYIQYEISWRSMQNRSILDLEFAEITQSPASAVLKALRFWNLHPNAAGINETIENHLKDTSRSNIIIGKIGRGAGLPDDVQHTLRLSEEAFRKYFAAQNISMRMDGIFF